MVLISKNSISNFVHKVEHKVGDEVHKVEDGIKHVASNIAHTTKEIAIDATHLAEKGIDEIKHIADDIMPHPIRTAEHTLLIVGGLGLLALVAVKML